MQRAHSPHHMHTWPYTCIHIHVHTCVHIFPHSMYTTHTFHTCKNIQYTQASHILHIHTTHIKDTFLHHACSVHTRHTPRPPFPPGSLAWTPHPWHQATNQRPGRRTTQGSGPSLSSWAHLGPKASEDICWVWSDPGCTSAHSPTAQE